MVALELSCLKQLSFIVKLSLQIQTEIVIGVHNYLMQGVNASGIVLIDLLHILFKPLLLCQAMC